MISIFTGLNNRILIFFLLGLMPIQPSTVTAQSTSNDDLPSLNNKKVLIVYGGWEGHKPYEFVKRILPWLEDEGAEVMISDSLGVYTDEKIMDRVDLIIQSWTAGKISKEQLKGLLGAIKNGVGIAGCHGGIGDSFRDQPQYQYMIGGQWTEHPGGQIEYQVDVIDDLDPITRGLSDFSIKTEQYYMLIDPNSKVLATSSFTGEYHDWIDGAVMPVVWKKYYAKGRVFYSAIGHNPEDLDDPNTWTIFTRGVRWASGSKYLPKEQLVSPVYPRSSAQD